MMRILYCKCTIPSSLPSLSLFYSILSQTIQFSPASSWSSPTLSIGCPQFYYKIISTPYHVRLFKGMWNQGGEVYNVLTLIINMCDGSC